MINIKNSPPLSPRPLYLSFLGSYNICIIYLYVIEACLKVTIAWKNKTRVKSSDTGVTTSNPQITSLNPQVTRLKA